MTKFNRRRFIMGGILASLGFVLIDSFWFEKYIIDWNYFNLKKSGQPPIKIVQISDLHIDQVRSFHRAIAKKINKLQPDLIVFTGDSVDAPDTLEYLDEFLKLIDHSMQKYAILGNWEYWGNVNLSTLKNTFTRHNCELLVNEHRTISIKNRSLNVIGIDDFVGGNADFISAVDGMKAAEATVVLTHCPEHRDVIIKQKGELLIDLVLCGHTHGGQITFFGWVPFKPKGSGPYVKGWYQEKDPKMYISKGIGTSVLPIRLGARAEVAMFDL
ncbi:metallophosphoesterase [Gelidibacter salicanalis]|uniref:Metallophosphoesterase n=1 Tax=Gelidibacter salicanalis TaxID=291193 RepID=A0A5C7AIS3_9FLAO|nr:metallophosphoesterase [Gelidibacter salicanalis]TXE07769.1 metallophosphoesterase [Gelidibacter salicanalis]